MTTEQLCPSTGKVMHPTARAAKDAIADLVRRGKAHAARWNAYQCKDCKAWHKGHRPGTLQKDIRRALRAGNAANQRNRKRRR